jgi:hypothetical protein
LIAAIGFALLQHLEAKSAMTLLDKAQKIRPHASPAEIQRLLGPPAYTYTVPSLPPWLEASAVGKVTEGTIYIYQTYPYHTKLLIIHLTESGGAQFVTWEPT